MPKENRWRIKQEFDQAIHLVEKASGYLESLAKEYEPYHADIALALRSCINVYMTTTALVQDLRDSI